MAKKGAPPHFDMGEIDLVFGDKNLTVIYPNRTQNIYDVATTEVAFLFFKRVTRPSESFTTSSLILSIPPPLVLALMAQVSQPQIPSRPV